MDVPPAREPLTLPPGSRVILARSPGDRALVAELIDARERIASHGFRVLDPRTLPDGGLDGPERAIVAGVDLDGAESLERLVTALGPDRTWTVLRLPSIASSLVEGWQASVEAGAGTPFEAWLEEGFATDGGAALIDRWRRAVDDRSIGRWASSSRPERLIAVVLDEHDPPAARRTLEELLELPSGTLTGAGGPAAPAAGEAPKVASRTATRHRALTLGEIESVRSLNLEVLAANVRDRPVARAVPAAVGHVARRSPDPSEPAVPVPAWALERLRPGVAARLGGLEDDGIRVLDASMPTSAGVEPCVPPDAAAALAMGVLWASGAAGTEGVAVPRGPRPRWRRMASAGLRSLRSGSLVVRPIAARLPRARPAEGPDVPTAEPRTRPLGPRLVEPLPRGTRLVHVGPPKTGTTALQASFHRQRGALLRQGVRYAGRARHSASAVLAVSGRPAFDQDEGPPSIDRWLELVADVRTAVEPRVVISSEFFAETPSEAIPRIVGDLGGPAVHVVVTLRPLARIVPSQWQQYVQSGMRLGFEPWLRSVLADPPGSATPTFQRRHRHADLVARWAEVVGADHVTVVVVDERDHDQLFRVFEQLLGLGDGSLTPRPDVANRSMTVPEIEAVRAFNVAFRGAGLGNALFHRVMHFGAATFMKLRPPAADEPRIELSPWAVRRCAELSHEIVARIRDLGVRVVGDLDSLATTPDPGPADGDADPCISPAIAGRMAMGIAVATRLARARRRASGASGASDGDHPNEDADGG
jgi:hypothetical protein